MEKSKSSGIGIPGVLFIVFLVLKLTGNIDWSWWWVFSPIWISIGLAFAVILAVIIGLVIALSLGYDINKLKNRFGDKS
jgi:hypothetical protein